MSHPSDSAPRVTVIIPCWNNAATIERALQSVLDQSLSAAQVWVLDDASSDNTVQIAQTFIERHALHDWQVQVFQNNLGPSRTRNWGWDHATGDYVAFLDADDSWHPRKLDLQSLWLQTHTEFEACGHAHSLTVGTTPSPSTIGPHLAHQEISSRSILMRNPMVTPSIMVRRTCTLRFIESRRHMEDHLLWMRLVLSGHRLAKLDAELTFIHKPLWGSGGLSAQMWAMEKAELQNYKQLLNEQLIGPLSCLGLWLWSLGKFVRRCVLKLWGMS